MTPREELIEAMVAAVWGSDHGDGEWRENMMTTALDVMLARRDLLLEALGAKLLGADDGVRPFSDEDWWRFPVSEEAQ